MTKVSPFRYPKSKHTRKLSPLPQSSYRKYKPFLREEFGSRCVYCTLSDLLKGQESFGVDHYKPKKKFPSLETEYSNLFYACNVCNSRKGDFWPSSEQLANRHFVPNPCDHIMYDCLGAAGPFIKAKNSTGKFALDILDLNDPRTVRYRQMVIDVCSALNTEVGSMDKMKRALVSKIRKCSDDVEKDILLDELDKLESRLQRVQGQLCDLVGT